MRRKAIGALVLATAGLFLVGPAGATDLAIHGSVSQGYIQTSDYQYPTRNTDEGTWSFNEAIVNFSTQIDDKTRIGLQILGRDFGGEGNNQMILDWAFGDYRWKDVLGFRAGKVKTPLGFYNKTRDVDAVRTAVFLPQSVYPEEFRSVTTAFQGVSAYGDVPVGDMASFEYEVYGGTIEMGSSEFMKPIVMQYVSGPPVLDFQVETEYVFGGGATFNTPLEGLRVGATFMRLEFNSETTFAGITPDPWAVGMHVRVNSWYTLSAEYLWNDLTLAAEFNRMDNDFGFSNMPVDPDGPGPLPLMGFDVGMKDHRGGYYGSAAYRISPLLELGTYYSVYHPDWSNRDGEGLAVEHLAYQKDWTFTARFDVTDNWILKVEGHLIKGTGQLNDQINTGAFDIEDWNMFSAKSTFYF
jgi:hypothetical protein